MAGCTDNWCDNTHFLVESQDVEKLQLMVKLPLQTKYTSIAVSVKYIAAGLNTGAVRLFSRVQLHCVLLIAGDTKEGIISHLAFSPTSCDFLAIVTGSGVVTVMQLNMEKCRRPETLCVTEQHRDSLVTAVAWSRDGNSLYIGDNVGVVTRVFVPTDKKLALLTWSPKLISRFESKVVQLDAWSDYVLISTLTAAFIANNTREQIAKIGTKPRSGEYGACFSHVYNSHLLIYSARPGARVWRVQLDGRVVRTLQLKPLLSRSAQSSVISLRLEDQQFEQYPAPATDSTSVGFQKLYMLDDRFLLACCNENLYILDPTENTVVLWTKFTTGISALCCCGNDIYVLDSAGLIHQMSLLSAGALCTLLYERQQWSRCALLLTRGLPDCRLPRTCLAELLAQLTERGNTELVDELHSIMSATSGDIDEPLDRLSDEQNCTSTENQFYRTASGMYVRAAKPSNTSDRTDTDSTRSCDSDNLSLLASQSSNNEVIAVIRDKLAHLQDHLVKKLADNLAPVTTDGLCVLPATISGSTTVVAPCSDDDTSAVDCLSTLDSDGNNDNNENGISGHAD